MKVTTRPCRAAAAAYSACCVAVYGAGIADCCPVRGSVTVMIFMVPLWSFDRYIPRIAPIPVVPKSCGVT